MHIIKILFTTFVLFIMSTVGYAQLVNNAAELNNAINAASPGTTIILANGEWNNVFIDFDKNGTSAAPITITAQNLGDVLMTGNSRVRMQGAYLAVSGLVFQDPADLVLDGTSRIEPVFDLDGCNYCKVIDNKIDSYNGTEDQKSLVFKWVLVKGQHNEVAYNSFIGKYGVGSIINDNRSAGAENYLKIHHNYFADRRPINGINDDNDQDAIRLGSSSTSLSNSFSEVHDNYFYNFFGEIEVISNKSGGNKYYNNTFRNYAGNLTLRHGNNCEVYNNYFFAEDNEFSGGVRVIGEGHKIYNNYIEGVNSFKLGGSLSNGTGGINVSNGRLNSELNGYLQVKNAQIVNNTFVNCDYALRIGTNIGGDLDQAPENLIIANNITYNSSIRDDQIATIPIGNSISEGNIYDLPNDDMVDDGNFHRLTSGSQPIDAGVGNYAFLTQDVLGGNRDTNFDAGAEEFAANGNNLPYTQDDLGIDIGFGAGSNLRLELTPSTINFGLFGGMMTFEIIANVDWEINDDLPWLSFDITSGSGRAFVTVTADENTTRAERTGNISINETSGNNSLTTTLTVEQSNIFVPVEIPIIGSTSVGMQDKVDIAEENAYNDDLSNYWTGDPDMEPEVSITFDLSCIHELSEIGINFWKADERTTTFSIAVADEADDLFTIVIDGASSSIGTVDTEQVFDLEGTTARYVKFIGIGNSSSSNWTSIANVNIYGNPNCEGASNIFDNQSIDPNVTIYPIPVTNGFLNISTTSEKLEGIEIFNVVGQRILTTKSKGSFSTQIDVSKLNSGVYFLKLEKLGQTKFILK